MSTLTTQVNEISTQATVDDTCQSLSITGDEMPDETLMHRKNVRSLTLINAGNELAFLQEMVKVQKGPAHERWHRPQEDPYYWDHVGLSSPLLDTVESLSITNTPVTDEKLAMFRSLKHLELRNMHVTLNGLLAPNTNSSYANRVQSNMARGMAVSSIYQTLESLSFCKTQINNNSLRQFQNLKKLIIRDTNVSLMFLAEYPEHPLCHTLEYLDCASSDVSDYALQHLRSLKYLNIRGTKAKLSFLTPTHPLCDTLEGLDVTGLDVDESHIQYLRSLRVMNSTF